MRCFVLPLMLLAACDTPSLAFRDAPMTRITVGQSTFDVRVKDKRAEAIRTNAEWAPRPAAVEPRAVAAIERVSGCEVKRLRGDQAMMVADLKCKGSEPPPPPVGELRCEQNGKPLVGLGGEVTLDISCVEVVR